MSSLLRHTVFRRVVAALAAPLLLGSVSAAEPSGNRLHGSATVTNVDFRQTFYSDPAKTVQVGVHYYYCDGTHTEQGYITEYYKIVYYMPRCP